MGFHEENVIQPLPTNNYKLSTVRSDAPIRAVLLTTTRIDKEQLWSNGLYQNVLMIYTMMEAAGFQPFLVVDDIKKVPDSEIQNKYRTIDLEIYSKQPFPVLGYVEMGMSCDTMVRNALKSIGCRVIKLYLGNILNIDIETPMFYKDVFFNHHISGGIDEIWVSPHYWFHKDYAGQVNGNGPAKIAPYIWDPTFIQPHKDIYKHKPSAPYSFTIMEPNISFQKTSFVPIMICEALYKKNPKMIQDVVVINGERLKAMPYFAKNILVNLEIYKAGKLLLLPRSDIMTVTKNLTNNVLIQHSVNNEYNYSFLEHMWMGFPVIHNFSAFKDFAYYYDDNNIEKGVAAIEDFVHNHGSRLELYKSHAQALAWRFSGYNPENQRAWMKLLLKPAEEV